MTFPKQSATCRKDKVADSFTSQNSQADTLYHEGQFIALGLCLGGLPSAAVCSSRNALDLIPRAVEAVKAAFRTGLKASEMAKRLVPRTSQEELDGSWAILCSGYTAPSEALSKYWDRTVGTPYNLYNSFWLLTLLFCMKLGPAINRKTLYQRLLFQRHHCERVSKLTSKAS